MEGSIIRPGDVVTVKFPYIDEEEAYKNRPALVIATPHPMISILCEITTNLMDRPHTVSLSSEDFVEGGLRKRSVIRADVITTFHHKRLKERVGHVDESKLAEVLTAISAILYSEVH
ncbi:MAG: type II toxin-antitoxin system PemK/MazF family toxin [Candidatus Kapaibacterium sp.]